MTTLMTAHMTQNSSIKINYQSACFLTSSAALKQCPSDSGAEIAFAGRSNAGKSSAINVITGQKKLARTSKTPGRTQLLNFFALNNQPEMLRIVDLPGYGFAKVPDHIKRQWHDLMESYLQERKSLKALILVMDIRHPLQAIDETMLNWAHMSDMPAHVLLTKSDKLKRGPAKSTLLTVKRYIEKLGAGMSVQLFSSHSKEGVIEARQHIQAFLSLESSTLSPNSVSDTNLNPSP